MDVTTQQDRHAGPDWSGIEVTPLLAEDPAKIGDFWLDGRIIIRPGGRAWLGHGDGLQHLTRGASRDEQAVVVVQMSEGASDDRAARDRFSGYVNHLHIDHVVARGGQDQDEGRLGRKFRSEDDDPVTPTADEPMAPWVALAHDGSERAGRQAHELLAEVDLVELPPQRRPAGPDFRMPWFDRLGPGRHRVWPLPWPGRHDRAGWLSILASWVLMVLLAFLAVLIAILLFRNAPPQQPPPDTGQSASSSGSASGSPSPQSGSPTPDPSGSPSQSGSPTPDDSASPGGSPTPPSKM